MSRIGKIPVELPKDVKAVISNGSIEIQGPKGKLNTFVPIGIKVEQQENKLIVNRLGKLKQDRTNQGTIRSLLENMIIGVTNGHKKELEIQGIGFRAQLQGNKITFNLGLSHPVEFEVPEGVKATVPTQTSVTLEGIDKILVGQVAAKIKDLKPAEPYKGKGIRYAGEIIRRKQGKSVTK